MTTRGGDSGGMAASGVGAMASGCAPSLYLSLFYEMSIEK